MPRFVEPVLDRQQCCFLQPTLEESIPLDHPVRVFDFVMDQYDWSDWERQYGVGGRPPFPPDVMSKLLVYGYSIGMRSSRVLEHACQNNRDFIWLMQGRTPDHDTIANFRREHRREFKKIFRDTVAVCVEAGMVSLKHLAVDGTRVRAHNGREQTRTAEQIQAMLQQLDERLEKVLREAEVTDRQEDLLFGQHQTPHQLPRDLKDLKRRQLALQRALKKVQAKAEAARRHGDSAKEVAGKRVPITDPDADVMKDKQGHYGPQYAPFVGVETSHQMIASEGVTNVQTDDGHLVAAVEEAEDASGQAVEQVQADSSYATPANLTYLEEAGIDPCLAPYGQSMERRKVSTPPWPTQVPGQVAQVNGTLVDGTSLPRDAEGRFEKSTFRYEAEHDRYICPLGRVLDRAGTHRRELKSGVALYTVYQCRTCGECPWVSVCTKQKDGRSVKRGEHDEIYERHAERMKEPQRRADYRLRRQTVEPAIGTLKHVLKLQQFLLRGLEGVRAEWSLACAAFNIKKLARILGPPGVKAALAGFSG
jgi:transposase